jgi:hypothetical protein
LLRKLSGDGQVLEARVADEIVVLHEYRAVSSTSVLDRSAEAMPVELAAPIRRVDLPPAAASA